MKNKKIQYLEENRILNNKSHYKAIKEKKHTKRNFFKLYEEECVYCSLPKDTVIPFEIDHFIPLKGSKGNKKLESERNNIENLVCSCQRCNRNKGSEDFSKCYHPDEKRYSENWIIDENYYTKLKEEAKTNNYIEEVYKYLKLGYEDRRIINIYIEFKKIKHCLPNDEMKDIDKIIDELGAYINLGVSSDF